MLTEPQTARAGNARRSSSVTVVDVEKQGISITAPVDNDDVDVIRADALQNLFGYAPEALQNWPGLRGYCRYLEACFQSLLADRYAALWTTIGAPRPRKSTDCWSWFNAVSKAIRSMEERDTMAHVLEVMKRSSSDTKLNAITKPSDETSSLIAIFAVLCWSSMTLQPMLCVSDSSTPGLWAQQQSLSEPTSLKMDTVRRPIAAAFRNFRRNQCGSRSRQPICDSVVEHSSVLFVSTLNFQSLQTIGKIRLKWVNDLSSHLDFESRKRTLSLFRFPSFCAMTTAVESRGLLYEG